MDIIDHLACRLCFDTEGHLIDIFDEFESNIANVISEHIGKVTEFNFLFSGNSIFFKAFHFR